MIYIYIIFGNETICRLSPSPLSTKHTGIYPFLFTSFLENFKPVPIHLSIYTYTRHANTMDIVLGQIKKN